VCRIFVLDEDVTFAFSKMSGIEVQTELGGVQDKNTLKNATKVDHLDVLSKCLDDIIRKDDEKYDFAPLVTFLGQRHFSYTASPKHLKVCMEPHVLCTV
jgi:hypothetical protein